MDIEYLVNMSVTLEPVRNPWVKISVGHHVRTQQLTQTETFNFKFASEQSTCLLEIEHFEKIDNDPDTAVVVKDISFFEIADPKFVWAGVYYPNYPDHYPKKVSVLPGQGYLGWNGVYQLEFDVPVFTWMHRILNLGDIYQ